MRRALLVLLLVCGGCEGLSRVADTDPGECDRFVLEGDVVNARDLGGWPVDRGLVLCRRLLRGGALSTLTEEGCGEFAGLGVKTIIDLREAAVQASTPPPGCATEQAVHVSAAMPKLLPDTPENYLALLDESEAIRVVFAVLGDAAAYPVYVHCEIGRDRASFASALILLALGATTQTVLDEFALSQEAGVAVKPRCLSAVLEEIEVRGGISTFLAAAGVPAADLDGLRQAVIAAAL